MPSRRLSRLLASLTLLLSACSAKGCPAQAVSTSAQPIPAEPSQCPYPVSGAELPEPDLTQFNPIHAFDQDDAVGAMALDCVRLGTLPVPTGRLVLLDPQVNGRQDVDVLEVPAGEHELYVARRPTPPLGDPGQVGPDAIAYALLMLSDERPVEWGSGFMGKPVAKNFPDGPWPDHGCCAALFDASFGLTVGAELGDRRAYPPRTFVWEERGQDARRASAGELGFSWSDAQLRLGEGQGYYVQHRMARNVTRYLGFDAQGELAAVVLDGGLFATALAEGYQAASTPVGAAACPAAGSEALARVDCPFVAGEGEPRMFGVEGACLAPGELAVATGRVVVDDPLAGSSGVPLPAAVEPGRYPVFLRVSDDPGLPDTLGAVLVVGEAAPRRWARAWRYGVDSGTAAFMDLSAHATLDQRVHEAANMELDAPLLRALADRRQTCVEVVPETGANVVLFSSGQGDGVYDIWLAYGAGDELVAIATEFSPLDP